MGGRTDGRIPHRLLSQSQQQQQQQQQHLPRLRQRPAFGQAVSRHGQRRRYLYELSRGARSIGRAINYRAGTLQRCGSAALPFRVTARRCRLYSPTGHTVLPLQQLYRCFRICDVNPFGGVFMW